MTDAQGPVSPSPSGSPEPAKAGGSKKWWIIGCGGCLGLTVIVAGLILAGLYFGTGALRQASDKAVSDIFGPGYQPEGYTAIGVPVGQKDFQSMVMLMDMQRGGIIVAVDSIASPEELKLLKGGDKEKLAAYVQALGSKADRGSSDMNLKNITIQSVENAKLANGKQIPVAYVRLSSERKGYSPGVISLVPEANGHLIVLFAMDAHTTSSNPDADFKAEQQALNENTTKIINDSALDDRI